MQQATIERLSSPPSRRIAAEVRSLHLNRRPLRLALRQIQCRGCPQLKSSIPLRIRGSRYLQLSASATAAPFQEFQTVPVNELTPIRTPVPDNYSKIRTIEPSELKKGGRIIVVGDVHGCYEEFCSLLEACEFDKDKDNLIMAGDLVNKGPDSLKVLKKAMKLQAFVVRGNHEDNALAAYFDYARGMEIEEKYAWVKELKKKHLAFLEGLPFVIRVPSHKLLVVHAGLVPGTELEKQDMFAMYRMRDVRKCTIRDSWIPLERGIQESIPWASQWTGPEHVIFGHDSSRRLQLHPFATGIDTGAVQGDHLTACVFPPVESIPDISGPAFRENLKMQIWSFNVDGPKKVLFPKPEEELAKHLVSAVTVTDNMCMDMYATFETTEALS